MALIKALGTGTSPGSLGLKIRDDGYVDMTKIRIPLAKAASRTELTVRPEGRQRPRQIGAIEFVPDRTIFSGVRLERVDFSQASLENAVWEAVHFERVQFDSAGMRTAVFRSGLMKSTSFRRANLRDTHWGSREKTGPEIVECDFSDADLRGATFGFPLFRGCRFSNTKLDGVDLFGARFEDCVFEGRLFEVLFHGKNYFPGNSEVEVLRNTMKNVDFSNAELRWVEFDLGIDLSSCKFPSEGYVRIAHPRRALTRALQEIKSEWTGDPLRRATFFLENILKRYPVEQPFTILRPQDLVESPMGPDIGAKLVAAIQRASE